MGAPSRDGAARAALAGVLLALRLPLASTLRPAGPFLTLPLERLEPAEKPGSWALPVGARYALAVVVGEGATARTTRMLIDTGSSMSLLIEPWEEPAANGSAAYRLVDGYAIYGCAACEACVNRSCGVSAASLLGNNDGNETAETPDNRKACSTDCTEECEAPTTTPSGQPACKSALVLADGLRLPYAFVRGSAQLAPRCSALRDENGAALSDARCALQPEQHGEPNGGVGLPIRARVHRISPCSVRASRRRSSDTGLSGAEQQALWSGLGGVLGLAPWPSWPGPASERVEDAQWWLERLLSAGALAPTASARASAPRLSYALELRPERGAREPTLVLGGDWDAAEGMQWAGPMAPFRRTERTRPLGDGGDEGGGKGGNKVEEEEGAGEDCGRELRAPPSLFAFDLTLCGQPLLPGLASSWPLNLTTATPCLVLPPALLAPFARWAPAHCPESAGGDGEEEEEEEEGGGSAGASQQARRCFLPRELDSAAAIAALPALEFRLREGGPLLRLPLADLLLPRDSEGRRPYCVHASVPLADEPSAEPAQGAQDGPLAEPDRFPPNATRSPIVFGAAALLPFVAAVQLDASRARVGLAQQPASRWSEAEQREHRAHCPAARACRGQERFEPLTNSCVPPQCNVYLQALHSESGTCGFPAHFRLAAVLIITIVALVDLGNFEVHKLLGARVRVRTPARGTADEPQPGGSS